MGYDAWQEMEDVAAKEERKYGTEKRRDCLSPVLRSQFILYVENVSFVG